MSKAILLAIICSLYVTIEGASLAKNDEITSNIFVTDLQEFLRANPEFHLIGEMERHAETKGNIAYTLGNRISGDRLVAELSENNSYSSPRNVVFNLTYPREGLGAVVTFVRVDVQQSTTLGRGFLLGGGIGFRQIVVAIEAENTTYFNQKSQVFGY